jgi:esterase/lipase
MPINPILFTDPKIQDPIDQMDLPFSHYIDAYRDIIQSTRPDGYREKVLAANMPFELQPRSQGRTGALLIHGLLDAPFIMRDAATALQKQDLLVRAIVLPGHGTRPGALLSVTYQAWIEAVRYGILNLAKEVDRIILVGFSTGASLALYHALQNTHASIAGLVLLAPAISITPLSRFTNLPQRLGVKRLEWLHQIPENDYAKYQSMPFNAAYQVYLLTQEIHKISTNTFLKQPTFIAVSTDDQTISTAAALQYFREHPPRQSELLCYTNAPNEIHDTRIVKRPADYPAMNITNISHVAIPVAADNSHYGMYGDYPLASHVETHAHTWYGTVDFKKSCLNVLYKMGLKQEHYERLTFNPDFGFLMETVKEFIERNRLK